MSERNGANRPADVIRDGGLKATIWENTSEKSGAYYTTQLAKTYEDENGKLKDTTSFSGADLLKVAELARQAYTRSNELRREARRERQAEVPLEEGRHHYDDQPHDQPNDQPDDRDARRDAYREQRGADYGRNAGNGRGNGRAAPRRSVSRSERAEHYER